MVTVAEQEAHISSQGDIKKKKVLKKVLYFIQN